VIEWLSMSFLDFLFPKQSLGGREGAWVTEEELESLTLRPKIFEIPELRKRGIRSLDRVFAMGGYHDSRLLKDAIHTFKYRRIPGVGEALADKLSESSCNVIDSDSCLCPVPLHFLRKFWRGFNQATYLAERVSKSAGVPVCNLLKRTRPTGHQAKRGKKERWKALRGAFRMKSKNCDGHKTVYLVDDVFTTGSTLEECARVLKKGGVERVEAVVLAYD